MGSRRSRFQISVDVLTAVASGEQKTTRIMYACNLSWNSIKDTLDLLASKGYVDEMKEKKIGNVTSLHQRAGKFLDIILVCRIWFRYQSIKQRIRLISKMRINLYTPK